MKLRIVGAFLLAIILVMGIGCCVVIGTLLSHLLVQCGFAELIVMLILEVATILFCVYHLFIIGKSIRHYRKSSGETSNKKAIKFTCQLCIVRFLEIVGSAIAISCFIILVLFTVIVVPLQQQTYPLYNGTLTLPNFKPKGSSAPLILRESNGVVHIKASHDYDLFFAQGVAVAQDRLWQLELHRRVSNGILAEVAGAEAVSIDTWFRTLGFARTAEKVIPNLDSESLSFIQAYCDGINSYIASNPPLQPEFILLNTKPVEWTPKDVLAFIKVIGYSLSDNLEMEVWRFKMMQRNITKDRINELVPFHPSYIPTILNWEELNLQNLTAEERNNIEKSQQHDSATFIPEPSKKFTRSIKEEMYASLEESGEWGQVVKSFLKGMITPDITGVKASNNWVLGSKITANNGSLLANDPHLSFSAPGLWYLNHLEGPNHNVIGSSFVGIPSVVIGKNDFISWGVTNGVVDSQDLYVMSEVEEGKSYNYNGKVLEYETRVETIKVMGASAKTITVKESVYGPVINEHYQVDGNVLCLKSLSSYSNDTTIKAFLKLNRARDWNGFVDAVSLFISPSQNFVFSDKNGNIGYYFGGLVPIRKSGHNGRFPVIGNGTYDWLGFIPNDDKPKVFNPKKGYISSANNRVTPIGYKYSITQDWNAFHRASRIVTIIETAISKGTPLDFEFMKKMQHDVHSSIFDQLKFVFEVFPNYKNLTGNKEKFRKMMVNWDDNESMHSQEASIFEMWYNVLGNMAKNETFNRWSFAPYLYNAFKYGDSACEKYHNTSCIMFAIKSFESAIDFLESTYGSIPLWGATIHSAEFPNTILDGSALKCLASVSRNIVLLLPQYQVFLIDK